jgi:hypothetical protein
VLVRELGGFCHYLLHRKEVGCVGLKRADSQILGKNYGRQNENMNTSVADPDPAYHFDADPDQDPTFH